VLRGWCCAFVSTRLPSSSPEDAMALTRRGIRAFQFIRNRSHTRHSSDARDATINADEPAPTRGSRQRPMASLAFSRMAGEKAANCLSSAMT
jgi:hypothetical protein